MASFTRHSLKLRHLDDPVWAVVLGAARESDTFQAILEEGRQIQARRLIRRLAQRTLGEPDAADVARLEAITDIDRLERIMLQVGEAPTWQDLLDTP